MMAKCGKCGGRGYTNECVADPSKGFGAVRFIPPVMEICECSKGKPRR
jgi:hypothetical protein